MSKFYYLILCDKFPDKFRCYSVKGDLGYSILTGLIYDLLNDGFAVSIRQIDSSLDPTLSHIQVYEI